MKIYFLSSKPCALTLNGVFYGVTDRFERFAELSLSDKIYVSFSPEGAQPVTFFLTEDTLSTPPDGCEIYLLKDGAAIYANDFSPVDCALQPVAQRREGGTLATLFSQGKLQLTVESPDGFFNATLPPSFSPSKLFFVHGLILLKGEKAFALYTKDCKRLLLEEFLSLEWSENTLTATLPLSDALQRVADCGWELSENGCTLNKFTVRQPTDGKLPEQLLAYAFFESVLLRANYVDFLSDELQADRENILSFLGDFIAVTLTEEENVCGLVRKKGERLYRVDYYAVKIENGKISDIQC